MSNRDDNPSGMTAEERGLEALCPLGLFFAYLLSWLLRKVLRWSIN